MRRLALETVHGWLYDRRAARILITLGFVIQIHPDTDVAKGASIAEEILPLSGRNQLQFADPL